MKHLFATFLSLVGLIATAPAQDAKPGGETKPAKFTTTDGYPLDTCVVSGEALDDSAKVFTAEGHTFKTCCKKCQAKIEKDPKSYITQKEEAVSKAQSATYALTTCPISGKTLTDKAVSVVADNTLVKLCCPNCKEKLASDTATATAKVRDAAFEKQSANYSAKTCPVSGHDLDSNAVAVMHGTTLVKLCCDDCMGKFTAHANAMAAKVAPKAEAKSETKTETKAGEVKTDGKTGHETPMAAAVAGQAAAGGAACCETGKAESGCCQAAAGEKKSECCSSATKTEAGKEAKSECCADKAAGKEAKSECCASKTAEKTGDKAAEKPAEKKIN
jgi:hypothetical protein